MLDRGGSDLSSTSDTPSVEALIDEWLKFHVSHLAAPDRYHYSAGHLRRFFHDERHRGRLGDKVLVRDLTPQLQARFREWRLASGVGGHTVSRDVAALRGALTWAWKHQRIGKPPPFISDVPFHLRGGPRDRVLSRREIAAIIDACADRPDPAHLIRFIVIELGTAGRPEAVLELEHTNIDLERNLINPNHPGTTHARKRRAIVPMARAVRPWVVGIEGKLIKYRVPVSRGTQGVRAEFFERETEVDQDMLEECLRRRRRRGRNSENPAAHDADMARRTRGALRTAGDAGRPQRARYDRPTLRAPVAHVPQVGDQGGRRYFTELGKLTRAIKGPATWTKNAGQNALQREGGREA
jgi:hypothetical protein